MKYIFIIDIENGLKVNTRKNLLYHYVIRYYTIYLKCKYGFILICNYFLYLLSTESFIYQYI